MSCNYAEGLSPYENKVCYLYSIEETVQEIIIDGNFLVPTYFLISNKIVFFVYLWDWHFDYTPSPGLLTQSHRKLRCNIFLRIHFEAWSDKFRLFLIFRVNLGWPKSLTVPGWWSRRLTSLHNGSRAQNILFCTRELVSAPRLAYLTSGPGGILFQTGRYDIFRVL